MATAKGKRAWTELRDLALGYPGAKEDHPWGETVAKVGKKVFVFLGMPGDEIGLSVKLPQSGPMALLLPFVEPTGYGLGKSGWITARFPASASIPVDLLREWIDESYRAVAPKTLVKRLDPTAPKTEKKVPVAGRRGSAAAASGGTGGRRGAGRRSSK